MSNGNQPRFTLTQGFSVIALVAGAVYFGAELRADLDHLTEHTGDRFRGSDMDRFTERLKVELDTHCRDAGQPMIRVPDWRGR